MNTKLRLKTLKRTFLWGGMALLGSAALTAHSPMTPVATHTQMASVQDGWVSLFDGKTTKGWHTYLKPTAGAAWHVANGELRFNPKVDNAERGDLVTDKAYENFELKLEWQIAPGGNSGIIFGVHEDKKYGATYLTGLEMQVLDNISAADNKIPNHLAGTLYDLTGDASVSKPKALGEWNEAHIRKKDGRITLWLNGVQTADVTIGSPEWQKMLESSKFKDWEGFAKYPKGKIALQDHGDVVAYRNIRIKEL
jgi:hypothetical protein